MKPGDIIKVRMNVLVTNLDYDGIACVPGSFEGDPDLEPEQALVVYPMDIEEDN